MTKQERKLKKLKKKLKQAKYDQNSRHRHTDEYNEAEKEIRDIERQFKKQNKRSLQT